MRSFFKWTPLFATNFLGVLNNNFLRNFIAFVCITLLSQTNKELIVTLASGLYVLPYILFSPIGGRLAKRYNKSDVMFWSKCTELCIFSLACIGFFTQNIYILLFCVFSVGLMSTLFSPSKYGLIRDIGGNEGISFGTGTLEMFTFLGVLIGTFIASVLADHYHFMLFSGILIGIALIQLTTSYFLKNIEEAKVLEIEKDTINPIFFLIKSFKWGGTIKNGNVIILGLSIFWMMGNFIIMNLIVHCDKVLHMTNTQTGILMDISGVGIGIGSMLTGLLSKHKVQLKFTPIGGLGMIVCLVLLYVLKPAGVTFSALIFFVSFFCGMYMVPLSSWVQHSVEGRLQGDMLAYSNFVIFLLILISAGIYSPFVAAFGTEAVWLLMVGLFSVVLITLLINVKEMSSLFKKS